MRRYLHWGMAMVGVRADRLQRPAVREERLRTTAGLRGNPPLSQSAWRGLSGRRRVVAVHPLDAEAPARAAEGIAFVVRRDDRGLAHILGFVPAQASAAWWARQRDAGGNAVHVHRIAAEGDGPAAIAVDLTA